MQQIFNVASNEGLHYRPASHIVEICQNASCSVQLVKQGRIANPLSLISILKLGARYGEEILVIADGEGAEEVVMSIGAIITANDE